MSISTLTAPSSPAGAYDFAALKYEFVDDWAYTNTASDGGNLQLIVSASAVAAISVGEYVWVESLVDWPNIETPIVEVLSKGATAITVGIAYVAGFPTTGDIRRLEVQEFVVRTGQNNTSQPYITRTIEMRPDPNGVYAVNPYQSVISRFDFAAPVVGTGADYSHWVEYQVYEILTGAGSGKYAFQSIQGDAVASVIRYGDLENIVTYIDSNSLKTAWESPATQEADSAGTVEAEIDIFGFNCTTYEVTFSDPFDESFVTYDVEAWVSVQVSGLNVTGVTFDFSGQSAGTYTWTLSYDDGANTKVFAFTIYIQGALECRASCGGRRFFWWSREGGWCSYEFNRSITSVIESGSAQLRQVSNQISAVRYDKQQEVLTLLADYEGEAVFDYLKGMLYALNVYEAITFTQDSQVFDLYYLSQANGIPKRTQPYLATSNRFGVELVKGEIEERINEGR